MSNRISFRMDAKQSYPRLKLFRLRQSSEADRCDGRYLISSVRSNVFDRVVWKKGFNLDNISMAILGSLEKTVAQSKGPQ